METQHFYQDSELYYREAFARNIGIFTAEEQKRLRSFRVAIVGVGGVGGFHLVNLVRMGVGKFNIADMDSFEVANVQRQCGAFVDTFGKNKARVMYEMALSINPHLDIKVFEEGVSGGNINEFMEGVDILIDGIDFFSIDERRMVFKEAQKRGIYAVTAGPLGFGCAMLVFSPKGMGFDEYFDIKDSMSHLEKLAAFAVGLAPEAFHLKYLNLKEVNLEKGKGPALVSACNLCGAIAATEVVSILLKKKEPLAVPYYFQFDPYLRKMKTGYLWGGNRNPVQKLKRWYLINKFK